MNPRQRRGVILLLVATLGALAVFVSVLTFVSDVNARAGDFTSVVQLNKDVQAYEPITPGDVELRQVPKKWLSPTAIQDARDVVGLVPLNAYKAGTYASKGMFIDRPGIAQGNREIAIMVDAETGVAGKVKPGDRVDVIATFPGNNDAAGKAQLWVQDALIINVGVPESVKREDGRGGFSDGQSIPVTFALPVREAMRVAYAESFSTKMRLALRARNDSSTTEGKDNVFTDSTVSKAGN